MKIGVVSGNFSPILHLGHAQYFQGARNLSDKLIIICNNDDQIRLKGSKIFMPQDDREKFMKILFPQDIILMSIDNDRNVCETLDLIRHVHPNDEITFYNSGDRKPSNPENPSPETIVCAQLGIKKAYIDLTKIYSSSDLLK